MPDQVEPALAPEEWEARDYRQSARDLDRWAKEAPGRQGEDATEYVAKLGLSDNACVIVMSRAHDRVLVPPPARPALAAFALAEQAFGFTHADVASVRRGAEAVQDPGTAAALRHLADRLEALLRPATA